jgi:hypothetical protein
MQSALTGGNPQPLAKPSMMCKWLAPNYAVTAVRAQVPKGAITTGVHRRLWLFGYVLDVPYADTFGAQAW